MSRPILLSSSNLRLDNRRPLEARPHTLTFDTVKGKDIDGSACAEQGLTKVTSTVSGPKPNPASSMSSKDKVTINVEVDWIHFSGTERRPRGKGDRRLVELAVSVKNTFEPVIMSHLYPRSLIDISIVVLEQDGGVLSAAINATTLALIHAGISSSSPIASLTVSCLHDTPLIDPNSVEESELPTMTVACLSLTSKVTLVNMESRLSINRFEGMLRMSIEAVKIISDEVEQISREWAESLSSRMDQGRKGLETKRRAALVDQ